MADFTTNTGRARVGRGCVFVGKTALILNDFGVRDSALGGSELIYHHRASPLQGATMFPFGSTNPLEKLAEQIDRELQKIADWENRRRRSEILDQFADQMSHQWEMSSAYTNVVIAVGYAGLFATWSSLGSDNHPRLFASAGLLALASLLIFILWEVFKMTLLGRFMQLVIPQLDADPHRVHEAIDRVKELRTKMNLWFARTWLPVLIAILVLGLSAAAIVVALFVMRLF